MLPGLWCPWQGKMGLTTLWGTIPNTARLMGTGSGLPSTPGTVGNVEAWDRMEYHTYCRGTAPEAWPQPYPVCVELGQAMGRKQYCSGLIQRVGPWQKSKGAGL